MTRQEAMRSMKMDIIKALADHYHIEADDDEGQNPDREYEFDLNDYDWQAGCYCNGEWLSLAEVVNVIIEAIDY